MPFLLFNLLNDGVPKFMYPTLFMLIICLILLIKAFYKEGKNSKVISLIKHISLFALVWGFLGQMVGLIEAFDTITPENINPAELGSATKTALLNPTFGMVVFLIARLGLIILTLKKK